MLKFLTEEQKVVVESRIANEYEVVEECVSLVNGLVAYKLVKGRHCVVINTLGYDEHVRKY